MTHVCCAHSDVVDFEAIAQQIIYTAFCEKESLRYTKPISRNNFNYCVQVPRLIENPAENPKMRYHHTLYEMMTSQISKHINIRRNQTINYTTHKNLLRNLIRPINLITTTSTRPLWKNHIHAPLFRSSRALKSEKETALLFICIRGRFYRSRTR